MAEAAPDRPPFGASPFGQPVTQAFLSRLESEAQRIEGAEARHLLKSLRLRTGDTFIATDGRGLVARLEVVRSDARGLDAVVRERVLVTRPAFRIWLATGAEGARADWLVEKAVELGVWALVPLAAIPPRRIERWRRVGRAALKQSLGAWELAIDTRAASEVARACRFEAAWIAEPTGRPPAEVALPNSGDVLLVAGPPPGFPREEREAWGQLGASPVALGDRRLRAETAALALVVAALSKGPRPVPTFAGKAVDGADVGP